MQCEDCGCEIDGEMFDTEDAVLCSECYNGWPDSYIENPSPNQTELVEIKSQCKAEGDEGPYGIII